MTASDQGRVAAVATGGEARLGAGHVDAAHDLPGMIEDRRRAGPDARLEIPLAPGEALGLVVSGLRDDLVDRPRRLVGRRLGRIAGKYLPQLRLGAFREDRASDRRGMGRQPRSGAHVADEMGIGRLAPEIDDVAPVQHPQMRRHAGFNAQLPQDRLADLHDVPPLDGLRAEADHPGAQPVAAAVAQFLDHAVFQKRMDQADQGRAV